jgi:metal-responsive CopG/Arc/MetJ family transcriptional regulator
MRVRTNIIIEESILAKIDAIAGEKPKRAAIIETALREYIAREESKAPAAADIKVTDKKTRTNGKQKQV